MYQRKIQVKKLSDNVVLSCISKIHSNITIYSIELVKIIDNTTEEVLVEYKNIKKSEEANKKYLEIIKDVKSGKIKIS